MPAQFWRHVETGLSRFFCNDVQIVPHRFVADAPTAFREEKRRIGFGIGKVRADAVFVDAQGILRKRSEDRFAYPLARPLGSLSMPGLKAIVLVKEVSMRSQGIQMADFIGAQTAFAGKNDHRVVVFEHRLLKPAILGDDRLDLLTWDVRACQDVLEQAAQRPEIALDRTWLEPGVDEALTERDNALPTMHRFHGLPHESLTLPVCLVAVLPPEA